MYTLNTYPRGPNFYQFLSTTSGLRDARLSKSEMDRMISDWPWTLNCQMYPEYTEYFLSRGPNFHPFCCTTCHFPDTRLGKIRNALKDLNDLKHPTVKSSLHTLNTYPGGPNFYPFFSTRTPFWDNSSFWFPIWYNGESEISAKKLSKFVNPLALLDRGDFSWAILFFWGGEQKIFFFFNLLPSISHKTRFGVFWNCENWNF